MNEQGIHVLVSGKVQGVYYRETTRKRANELGISGWVKNLKDGRVELKAFSNQENLDTLLEYCRRGPIMARVRQIEVEPIAFEVMSGFRVVQEGYVD